MYMYIKSTYVHFKYLTLLCVHYTSIKLKYKKNEAKYAPLLEMNIFE